MAYVLYFKFKTYFNKENYSQLKKGWCMTQNKRIKSKSAAFIGILSLKYMIPTSLG